MTSFLVFALLFAQQITPVEKCTLSGTVVDSLSGLPLAKADIFAEPNSDQGPRAFTTTDATGKFVLVDLDPGPYHLLARRNGYLDTRFGEKRSSAGGSAITLTAGQKMEALKISLAPFGVIAGTVRDSDGEPLAGAPMQLYALHYKAGVRHAEFVIDLQTDDLGQYRFTNLHAGNYYVSYAPDSRSENARNIDHSVKSNKRPVVPIATFYPGTADPSAARIIAIAAGTRATGIDIIPIRSDIYKVAIHVEALAGLGALASLAGPGAPGDFRPVNTSGDMELNGVPPGRYTIRVGNFEPNKTSGGPSGRILCEMDFPLTVGHEDVTEVRLAAQGCVELTGRLTIEGEKPSSPQEERRAVVFGPEEIGSHVNAEPDGSFQTLLSPGQHTVDLSLITANTDLYVRSIRSGGQDVLRNGFAAAGSEHVELDIVLARNGRKFDGNVTDADTKPVVGAKVVLIPNDPGLRGRPDFYKTAVTDNSGHFELKGAAPGDYKLFAWDEIEQDSWYDPEVLKGFESTGEPIGVKADDAAGSQTIKLHVIR